MTEFNDLFPRSEGHSLEPRRTSWPKVEEHIRPILDTFQDLAGFEPHGFVRTQWVAGARDWYSTMGADTNLLRLAVEQMREKQLTIASPRSCITVALEIKGNTHPERYTTGKYAAFVNVEDYDVDA